MADVSDRYTITAWANHWADPGGVYALIYHTPDPNLCKADAAVYDRIQAVRGLTGIPRKGLGVPLDVPNGGYRRHAEYPQLEAWVIITRPGMLGSKLQERIAPCPSSAATYQLTRVDRIRADSNAIITALAKIADATIDPGISVGDVVGGVAGKGVSVLASNLADAVLPILIPAAIGFLLWRAVQK